MHYRIVIVYLSNQEEISNVMTYINNIQQIY